MFVLIATDPTPAHRPHEPSTVPTVHAVDGELVTPPVVDCPDPDCPTCSTGWFGLVSHGVCTTAMVVHRPGVTLDDLHRRIRDWLDCTGVIESIERVVAAGAYHIDDVTITDSAVAVDDVVTGHVHDIQQICAEFPVGTELSRLGSLVSVVAAPSAA